VRVRFVVVERGVTRGQTPRIPGGRDEAEMSTLGHGGVLENVCGDDEHSRKWGQFITTGR